MTSDNGVVVTIWADVQMVDETGYLWTFLHEAKEPDRVFLGALIVAGDPVEPFLARVVDIVDGPRGTSVVHLDVLGVPEDMIDELRHARVLPSLARGRRRHPLGCAAGRRHGVVRAFLDEARDPLLITTGAIVVTGDAEDPVLARVVSLTDRPSGIKVHLEILPGEPTEYADALARAHLLT